MGFRTVYGNDLLGPVACPPVAIASGGAGLAFSMQSVFTHVGIFWSVLMAVGAVSLGIVPAGTSSVFQRRNLFQMTRIHAVLVLAKLFDVVKLHSITYGTNQKLPYQPVTKRSSPFPISKGIAIFPHRKPQPAASIADSDLALDTFWQGLKEVHV